MRTIDKRICLRQRLIKADANACRRWRVDKPVIDDGRAGEYRIGRLRTRYKLLDCGIAEVDIQMGIDRNPNRRHIAWPVPRHAHAEGLAENRQLQGRRNPANLRNVAADKIDLSLNNQVMPFSRIIKQLPIASGIALCWRICASHALCCGAKISSINHG